MNFQQLNLRDVSLTYRSGGSGAAMVMVHGNISDMRTWHPLERLLGRHFHVISYSRRYSYPNQPPETSTSDRLDVHVDDLINLIERLELGPVHLVGNSSGAFVALLTASQRPDLVQTLTLEEPPILSVFSASVPPRPSDMVKLLLRSPKAFLEFAKFGATVVQPAISMHRRGDDAAAVEVFSRGVLGASAYRRLSTDRRRQIEDNTLAHKALLLGEGLPLFTASDANLIATPALLVHGVHTPAFQRRVNKWLLSNLPHAKEVAIASASHFAHEDNPDAVSQAIVSFCKSR